MKLIDTHCHLYLEDFDLDQEQLVEKAKDSGIDVLLLPNVDTSTTVRMHDLCDRHPKFAYPMMGLHPTSVENDYVERLKTIESFLSKRSYCGIGEIGIDLYWDKTYLKEQKIVFEEQLKWSIDLDLPVAIHTRSAHFEVLECIYKTGADKLKGVFHSFTGTPDELREIQELPSFKIGINGVITFKNSKLAETIQQAGIDKILLETDAPYLSPAPYRGRRNEPTYIWKTAEKVAETYGLSLAQTINQTRKNTLELFKSVNKPM